MKGVDPMTEQELQAESLVVLPQRLETLRWGGCDWGCGGCNWGCDGRFFDGHDGGYWDGGVRLHDVIIDNQ
jgi:hypothetical protein